MAHPTIDLDACSRMVAAASHACPTVTTTTPEPQHFDALATSFASLSVIIGLLTTVIAFGALLGLVVWGIFVRTWAKEEARRAADEELKRIAGPKLDEWLSTEGIAILLRASQLTQPVASPSSPVDISGAIADAQDDKV